jgi:hypothetical protein
MASMKEENLQRLWAEVRNLNQQLATVHREISRVELGLPEPFDFGKDWVPPYLREGSCIPLRTTMLPTKN